MIHKLLSLGTLATVTLLFPVIWAVTSRAGVDEGEGGPPPAR